MTFLATFLDKFYKGKKGQSYLSHHSFKVTTALS